MKSLKILWMFLVFVTLCNSISAQTISEINPCSQKNSERMRLIKEADKNPYRIRRMEFWGNNFIRDRALREAMRFKELNFEEGNLFSKEILEKAIKSLNKSFEIYPVKFKDVKIYLDRSNKDVGFVFCIKEK